MTAAELLQQLNELDECPRIEAKTGTEAGKSALQTVCAFANEPRLDGGHLLFGVARSDDLFGSRYDVVGVPDPDKLQADLASQCRSMFNRPIRPRMWVESLEGKPVVGAYVAESQAGDKPVFFEAQGLPRGAYRRIGSADVRCTEDDLLVFYGERQRGAFDQTPLPDAEIGELDPDAIADYRRERARKSPGAEELGWSDEDLLLGIGCAVRREGRVVPTVAGALLFGSRPLLRRLFPMMRLDYIRVPGRVWIEDPERRFETVDMRDAIIRLIRRGEAAILDDLPKRFHLPPGELQRRDEPRVPDRVIREALVNALMHRSYRTHGPTQIIRYANRIEIRNPGHSLKAEDRLGEPGSDPRNPLIASVLHETDFAETKGSGIRVMRRLMRDANLSPPTFESDRAADEFVATFFLHNLLDDEDLAWLAHFSELKLTNDEAKALVHVREAGRITNAEYRDLNGVDTLDASAHLRRLRDAGLLEQHDRGAATYYTPTHRLLHPTAALSEVVEEPVEPGEEPVELGEQPVGLEGEPVGHGEEPSGLAEDAGLDLPPELMMAVMRLNRWTPQPELRRLIRRLCRWRPLSAEELARIVGRAKTYLQSTYIGPMVRAGELEYTNPEKPSDPNQKYRATSDASN
ncbi:MAG TPA: ATP-binding protein [Longimicrobiaceae bacterium]|nr:ATP-binding protein [Longimicrobiaceae bacterium]